MSYVQMGKQTYYIKLNSNKKNNVNNDNNNKEKNSNNEIKI